MNFYLVKKHSFSYKKRLNTLYAFVCTVSYFMNNSKTVMKYFVDTQVLLQNIFQPNIPLT